MTDYSPGKGNLTKLITELLFLKLRLLGLNTKDAKFSIHKIFRETLDIDVSVNNIGHKPLLLSELKIHNKKQLFPISNFKRRELGKIIDDINHGTKIEKISREIFDLLSNTMSIQSVLVQDKSQIFQKISSNQLLSMRDFSQLQENEIFTYLDNLVLIKTLSSISPLIINLFESIQDVDQKLRVRLSRNKSDQSIPSLNIDLQKTTALINFFKISHESFYSVNMSLLKLNKSHADIIKLACFIFLEDFEILNLNLSKISSSLKNSISKKFVHSKSIDRFSNLDELNNFLTEQLDQLYDIFLNLKSGLYIIDPRSDLGVKYSTLKNLNSSLSKIESHLQRLF